MVQFTVKAFSGKKAVETSCVCMYVIAKRGSIKGSLVYSSLSVEIIQSTN